MPTLEPFDPSRPLVAHTFIRLHGAIYQKGNQLPYEDRDHRTLKRLYELRKIGYGEGVAVDLKTENERFLAGNSERRQQEKQGREDKRQEGGDQASEDQLAAADKMAKAHKHDDLFKAASGLGGVKKSMTKGKIALALVRAGREPA